MGPWYSCKTCRSDNLFYSIQAFFSEIPFQCLLKGGEMNARHFKYHIHTFEVMHCNQETLIENWHNGWLN